MSLPRPPEGPPRKLIESSRALRWAILVGAAVMVAIAIVLMFLLTQATGNRELYERNYGRLFAINMVVAAVLLTIIVWVALRLFSRVRRGKCVSRLPNLPRRTREIRRKATQTMTVSSTAATTMLMANSRP